MRAIVHIACVSLLLLLPSTALAQKKKTAEPDTIQVPFFHGVAVHLEVGGALQLAWGSHGQWEAGLRVNLKDKFFPAFEIGYGKAHEIEDYDEDSWFKTKAPYFRIGCDFNLLRAKHDNYKLFVGLRYAFSSFNYDISVKEEELTSFLPEGEVDIGEEGEEVSGTIYRYEEYDGRKATYHWLEAVVAVDAKIWGPLHLGWEIRYRRVIAKKYDEVGKPWYIPGFGDRRKGGFVVGFDVTLAI